MFVKKINKIALIFALFIFLIPGFALARDCSHCWCYISETDSCQHFTNESGSGNEPITDDIQCKNYCYNRSTDTESWLAKHCDDNYIDWNQSSGDICYQKTTTSGQDAESMPEEEYQFTEIEPRLSVPDFNVKFSDIAVTREGGRTVLNASYLAEYIAAIYQYMVGIATILAIVMIMYGGFRWITAAGNPETIGRAKDTIVSAIIGLAIALGSYTILNLVNPELVFLKPLELTAVDRAAADWSPLDSGIIAENQQYQAEIKAGGASPPDEYGNNNIPYFAQWTGGWEDDYCGPDPGNEDCRDISGNGCRLSSYAMVLKYYFPDQEIDPGVVSKYGGCACNAKPNSENFHKGPWGPVQSEKVDIQEAKELVNEGKPIVILCRPCVGLNKNRKAGRNYKGHYMVLTGYDSTNNEFTVNDPGSNPNKRITYMTPDMMSNPCEYANLSDPAIKGRCAKSLANPMLYYIHPQ
jgi:hypothetical protein